MSRAIFNLPHPTRPGAVLWQEGVYVTDGRRLLWIARIEGENIYLEDVCTECLEQWKAHEVMASLREVKPCSVT
jgi:hypothetical protein